MSLFQLILKKDDDWEIMKELGLLNCIHFVDLNKDELAHKLTYTNQLRRAEFLESKLQNLEELCFQYKVEMVQPASVEDFFNKMEEIRMK